MTIAKKKPTKTFTAEELAAMRERSRELRENEADGEKSVLEKIAILPEPDQSMAKKIHAIVKANAPELTPKTWYGMPAYANKDGKVVCFFQGASKFKYRYSTLGFNDPARLDEGSMWPIAYALTKLTPTEEAEIIALLKKAVK